MPGRARRSLCQVRAGLRNRHRAEVGDGLRTDAASGRVAGGGAVSGKRHDTDLAGLAAGNFTLGSGPGEHVARARVQDSLAVEFTAFAVEPSEEPAP